MIMLSRRSAIGGLISLVAASTLAATSASMATEDPPLAIKGYDPVAYFTEGRPAHGLSEFAFEWDEHRYLFASAEDRDLFAADPVRYAPQFANACSMALTRGEIHVADPENWLIADGKLYLFGEPVGPGLFKQDLAGNIDKANQNRPLIQR